MDRTELYTAKDFIASFDGESIVGGTCLTELKDRPWLTDDWCTDALSAGLIQMVVEKPEIVIPPNDPGQSGNGGEVPTINATDGAISFASQNEVDLDKVDGTGVDGRITKPDVEAYLEASTI